MCSLCRLDPITGVFKLWACDPEVQLLKPKGKPFIQAGLSSLGTSKECALQITNNVKVGDPVASIIDGYEGFKRALW